MKYFICQHLSRMVTLSKYFEHAFALGLAQVVAHDELVSVEDEQALEPLAPCAFILLWEEEAVEYGLGNDPVTIHAFLHATESQVVVRHYNLDYGSEWIVNKRRQAIDFDANVTWKVNISEGKLLPQAVAQTIFDFVMMALRLVQLFLLHEEDIVLLPFRRNEFISQVTEEEFGTSYECGSLQIIHPLRCLTIVEVRAFKGAFGRVGGAVLVNEGAFDDVLLQMANAAEDAFCIAEH